jgi:hypothetical protein
LKVIFLAGAGRAKGTHGPSLQARQLNQGVTAIDRNPSSIFVLKLGLFTIRFQAKIAVYGKRSFLPEIDIWRVI